MNPLTFRRMLFELVYWFTGAKTFHFIFQSNLFIFSDTVAVPVALGHYEDKIELLSKIASSPRLPSSHAIVLRGLEAARQQFQLHGRQGATRVVLLVTNGKHRQGGHIDGESPTLLIRTIFATFIIIYRTEPILMILFPN
jgi:hypothetical protein